MELSILITGYFEMRDREMFTRGVWAEARLKEEQMGGEKVEEVQVMPFLMYVLL